MGGAMTVVMVVMMVVMMGGMVLGGAWAFVRRGKRRRDDCSTRAARILSWGRRPPGRCSSDRARMTLT